jgi:hypothetical protein
MISLIELLNSNNIFEYSIYKCRGVDLTYSGIVEINRRAEDGWILHTHIVALDHYHIFTFVRIKK